MRRAAKRQCRWFTNPWFEADEETEMQDVSGILRAEFPHLVQFLLEWVNIYTQGQFADQEEDCRRPYPYTGSSGIAYSLAVLYSKLSDEQWPPVKVDEETRPVVEALQDLRGWIHEEAVDRLVSSVRNTESKSSRQLSFLDGNIGVYTVSLLCSPILLTPDEQTPLRMDLQAAHIGVALRQLKTMEATGSQEILYGAAGVLLASKLVEYSPECDKEINTEDQHALVRYLVESGQQVSADLHSQWPLMYVWHHRDYLGMAHGIGGILYTLLHFPEYFDDPSNCQGQTHKQLVYDTLMCVLQSEEGPGEYSSSCSASSGGDPMVHWCHGAGGLVFLFCRAYEFFGDAVFLEAALRCGQLIWQRGILRKGPGLCHGVSGNGFALLAIFKTLSRTEPPSSSLSKELLAQARPALWYWRACKFAQVLFTADGSFRLEANTPDRPASLYEGWAGVGPFLLALVEPFHLSGFAGFPLFEIVR